MFRLTSYPGASPSNNPAPPPSYMDVVLADGPDVYYRLSETGSDPFVDVIGAHNATPNGTINSQPSLLTADANASALFDAGTGFYSAQTSYIVSQQPMSVEWWQKRTGNGSSNTTTYVASCSDGSGGWGAGFQDSSHFLFITFGINAYVFTGTQATIGTTLHVVMTLDVSNNASLYLNGAFVETLAFGTPMNATAVNMKIGGVNTICFPRCVIDEFAVYKKLLTPSQIAAHYAAR